MERDVLLTKWLAGVRLCIEARSLHSILQFVINLYGLQKRFLICGIIPVTNRRPCQRDAAHARKEHQVKVAEFDGISSDFLETVAGVKWSTFPGCIGAWVAEMDYGTAPEIQEELQRVVADGFFGYMPQPALKKMQDACSTWFSAKYGWEVPVERIRPLPDVLSAMMVVMSDFTKPGAKVIVPTPAYMPFLFLPKLAGREMIEVPCIFRNDRWELDYDGIDAAFENGGGLFIHCNPHNPLGRVYDRDEQTRLSEIVAKHDGRVFSDEIHAPLTFPGHTHLPYASISAVTAGHTITAASASKAWNLAGLKCAQAVLSNDADAERWKTTAGFAEHGASTFGVIANAAAFGSGGGWLEDVLGYIDGNRKLLGELLAEHLPEVGYTMPEGTYLAWLDFRAADLGDDVDIFFREHAKVAVVKGIACGEAGKGFVRFNLAMSRPMLIESITRMAAAVRAHAPELATR